MGREDMIRIVFVLLFAASQVSCAVHRGPPSSPLPDANRFAQVDAQLAVR